MKFLSAPQPADEAKNCRLYMVAWPAGSQWRNPLSEIARPRRWARNSGAGFHMRGFTRGAGAPGDAPNVEGEGLDTARASNGHTGASAPAAGVVALSGLFMASPALSANAGAAPVVPGPAMSQPVRVVISAAQRPDPYNPSTVGNPLAASANALKRAKLTRHIHDVVAASGTVESDVDASDAVVADVSPRAVGRPRRRPEPRGHTRRDRDDG